MATQKRKLKRKYAATILDLQAVGVLLPSQWGLAESDNSLVMRHSDGINFTIIGGGAPVGSFINNMLLNLAPQAANFNITGDGRLNDLYLGPDNYTSGTYSIFTSGADLLIKNFAGTITLKSTIDNIILDAATGSIFMNSGALALPTSSTDLNPVDIRGGFVYFNDSTNTIRVYNGTSWANIGGGGSGEVNTASNLSATSPLIVGPVNTNPPTDYIDEGITTPGTNIFGLYAGKVGVDLQFRSLQCYTGGAISISPVDGFSSSLLIGIVHSELYPENMNNGSGIAGQVLTVNASSNGLEWTSLATGESNTASNLGSGVGLVTTKIGVDLPFKSLTATSNKISLTSNTLDIDIDVNQSNLSLNSIGGTLGTSKGGTNLTTVGLNGTVLTIVAGAPAWATLPTTVSSQDIADTDWFIPNGGAPYVIQTVGGRCARAELEPSTQINDNGDTVTISFTRCIYDKIVHLSVSSAILTLSTPTGSLGSGASPTIFIGMTGAPTPSHHPLPIGCLPPVADINYSFTVYVTIGSGNAGEPCRASWNTRDEIVIERIGSLRIIGFPALVTIVVHGFNHTFYGR